MSKREVETETNKVATGSKSGAASSHQAIFYNLLSPHTVRRLAKRLTVGGLKYGSVQWRQGINDQEYVTDRFNHLFEHLLLFMESGNEKDDNLGAMLWALNALCEIERLSPESFKKIIGVSDLYGAAATVFHNEEMESRKGV